MMQQIALGQTLSLGCHIVLVLWGLFLFVDPTTLPIPLVLVLIDLGFVGILVFFEFAFHFSSELTAQLAEREPLY